MRRRLPRWGFGVLVTRGVRGPAVMLALGRWLFTFGRESV